MSRKTVMGMTGELRRCRWTIAAVCALAMIGTATARAQTYTVLHRFVGSPTDGANSYAGLIGDPAGNLYGTTQGGGPFDRGTVFKLDKTGETVLYNFTGGADGGDPSAGVIRDPAGNLYGTTYHGGMGNCGVVYKVDTTGQETVLYTFTGGADGKNPMAGVIRDPAGNLYGTALNGGASGNGVVFEVDTSGAETLLHTFTGGADGSGPFGGLIRDPAGNLYGTAIDGGSSRRCPSTFYLGCGVVFKLDTTGHETVLHAFDATDGANPEAGLIADPAGNLYGTTLDGGAGDYGVVFKLDRNGQLTVLYSFTGGADGASPIAGVIRDMAGNLYGTTPNGGVSTDGRGVVFKVDTNGKETVVYSFAGFDGDGVNSNAGVIQDAAGNLYGTTSKGGISGNGVVFKLVP